MNLNAAAHGIARQLVARSAALGTEVLETAGVRVVDCGVRAPGGIDAGLLLARAALAGLGDVTVLPADSGAADDEWPGCPWPLVETRSAAPVAACLAAQCAGWKVQSTGFFAMASGPVRAAIGREPLYDIIGMRERPAVAVGVLEAARLPPAEACLRLAADAGIGPEDLTLLVARTGSPAGTVQVAARAVETALHKLLDVGFDVSRVRAGRGRAPLPPAPADDLVAIGRTNDAILYGSHVILEVAGPEAELTGAGARAVSLVSPAHGEAFLRIFDRAGRDFYAVDPALFAPARLDLLSLETGRLHRFGRLVERSFSG